MTARLPSMVEQLLACTGKRRATIGRPFPEGMEPGGPTERVLAILQAESKRLFRAGELQAIGGLSRGQVWWATTYLLQRGMIRATGCKENASYRRYQAVAKPENEC